MGVTTQWTPVTERLPPENVAVDTKIDDRHGVRKEQRLTLYRRLWFFPDKSMYVYYCPAHWRQPLPEPPKET